MLRFLKGPKEEPDSNWSTTFLQASLAYQETDSEPPQITSIEHASPQAFVENLITAICQILEEKQSPIPSQVVAELVGNLAHADFRDIVITISDQGNLLTIGDHGPGISNKEQAFLLGYYGQPPEKYRELVRGVGAGLPLARHLMGSVGGELIVTDNLNGGTVVIARVPARLSEPLSHEASQEGFVALKADHYALQGWENAPMEEGESRQRKEYSYLRTIDPAVNQSRRDEAEVTQVNMQGPAVAEALSDLQTKLSRRQRRVLFLVADLGEVGPSTASAELDMSVSTAFRDLVTLQEMGLVQSDENGKRSLTPLGARVIAALTA